MWGMLYSPEVKVPIIAYASGNADVYERLIKLWDEWLSTTPDREHHRGIAEQPPSKS
jgi:hypothetical protein